MSNAATTKTDTQYGIKLPNGKIIWDETPDKAEHYRGVEITGAALNGRTYSKKGPQGAGYYDRGRERMNETLRESAKAAEIDPGLYVAAHSYVTRDIITITMEPETLPELPTIGKKETDPWKN